MWVRGRRDGQGLQGRKERRKEGRKEGLVLVIKVKV